MSNERFGYLVDTCPLSREETSEAAIRLNCSVDENGRSQYVCVPNQDLTSLVEFCYTKTIVGIYQKGNCLKAIGSGFLDQITCTSFASGCPTEHFRSTDLYRYPACNHLNTEEGCFVADPSCSIQGSKTVKTSTSLSGILNASTVYTNYSNTVTTALDVESGKEEVILIVSVVASLLLLLGILGIVFFFIWKKRQKQRIENRLEIESLSFGEPSHETSGICNEYVLLENSFSENREENDSLRFEAPLQETYGNYDDEKLLGTSISERPKPINENIDAYWKASFSGAENSEVIGLKAKILGEYTVWKTSIIDHFCTLTDDEVAVLYCFLCFDYVPPNIIDEEWLNLLNTIRLEVFKKMEPMKHDRAQWILNDLKSIDFLWTDQTRKHLTVDARDEIMYYVANRCAYNTHAVFYLSSFITAQIYLRSQKYSANREPGEKCVSVFSHFDYFPFSGDSILIRRLQMDILTHLTINDTWISETVTQTLNVPLVIVNGSAKRRKEFLENLNQNGQYLNKGEKGQVKWKWEYEEYARPDIVVSCIGLYPHWDHYIIHNKALKKRSQYHHYPSDVRCLLYYLTLMGGVILDVEEESCIKTLNYLRMIYFEDLPSYEEITSEHVECLPKRVLVKIGSKMAFNSDDILNDILYAFVTECLIDDRDLQLFLTIASKDVVSHYCRAWDYEREEGERCIYIPDYPKKLYDLFIDKMDVHILEHSFISNEQLHSRISDRLKIPLEIFSWDIKARKRYIKSYYQGNMKMFRARGMIVGCSGAGKTTLLRNLQGRMGKSIPTETTVGLEVHEDMFEIKDDVLHEYESGVRNESMKGIHYQSSHETKLISMTDFAGQAAYYACHQVYLSRRAFYIVVIDMSKDLNDEVRKYNTDRHNPVGSLFHSWTYKDYFHFWLQSIRTYCDDENRSSKHEDASAKDNLNPVIVVASHKDNLEQTVQEMGFYEQLENCLSKEQKLKNLISPYRYFEVESPPAMLTYEQLDTIESVRKCIVQTVKQLPHWGEEIPLKWAKLEDIISEKKRNGEKVLQKQDLRTTMEKEFTDEEDLVDALKFFHEIGHIIYFCEKEMRNVIIADVQWFVDAFKFIITDEKHLARVNSKNEQINTGRISGKKLEEIWENIKDDDQGESYIYHKGDIIPYMDKLGLMTRVETQEGVGTDDEMYYIPSMNRNNLSDECKNLINRGEKTSVLVLYFKTYLPHFFFFRLVVNCLTEWRALDMKMFCKNAAFYRVEDATHYIAIAVNKTSIQLQVFTPDKDTKLRTEIVVNIRKAVENLIEKITKTFHSQTKYERGYCCKDINITDDNEEYFFTEKEISALRTQSCPKHVLGEEYHNVDKEEILKFWVEKDVIPISIDNK